MKRTTIGLVATALAALVLAALPAAAAANKPTSMYATAALETIDANGNAIGAVVTVERSKQGSELTIDQDATTFDANGTLTGSIRTEANVTSGFHLKIQDPGRLGGATVTAASLPATTCTYDTTGSQTGCVASTFTGLSVTWQRSGPFVKGGTQFPASVSAPTLNGLVYGVHEAFLGFNSGAASR